MSSPMLIKNPESFRSEICNKIESILSTCKNVPPSAAGEAALKKLAVNIEKGIFNFAIKEATSRKVVKKWENSFFVQLYIDRLRSIYTNMNTNTTFVEHIITGEITPAQLATMGHIEIAPSQWKDLIDAKIKKDMSKFDNNSVVTDSELYKCRKCGSRKIQYYELQTRSSDEPMSIFLSCTSCGKNFKIN